MFAKSRQDTLYIIHTEYNWGICEQEIQEIHKKKKKQKQEQARQQLERNQMQTTTVGPNDNTWLIPLC